MPNLAISAVVGQRSSHSARVSGKIWCASLLRHLWDGQILIGRNFPQPLFPFGRPGLDEVELPQGLPYLDPGSNELSDLARQHTLALAAEVAGVDGWVLLADTPAVVLRNLDHLFDSDRDVLVSRVAGHFEPGFLAVRGSCLREFVVELQSVGIEVALRGGKWTWAEFERGEVLHAADPECNVEDFTKAAVLLFSGLDETTRRRAAFGFHMMSVYDDEAGHFLDILES